MSRRLQERPGWTTPGGTTTSRPGRPASGPAFRRRDRTVLQAGSAANGLDARDLDVRGAVGLLGQPEWNGGPRTAGHDIAPVGHDLEAEDARADPQLQLTALTGPGPTALVVPEIGLGQLHVHRPGLSGEIGQCGQPGRVHVENLLGPGGVDPEPLAQQQGERVEGPEIARDHGVEAGRDDEAEVVLGEERHEGVEAVDGTTMRDEPGATG